MSFIWPYAPMDVMTERLQWLTDVLQARSAEQRICMREIPRRAFSMSHMMSAARYSEAQQTVREEEDFLMQVMVMEVMVALVEVVNHTLLQLLLLKLKPHKLVTQVYMDLEVMVLLLAIQEE